MILENAPIDAPARLVAGLLDRVDELGDAMAERIAVEANHHGECAVPMDDLRSSSRAELRNFLDALGGLAPLDTGIGAETGRRRARQDVPEVTLLAGYRVGIRFVWELLMAEAARTGLVGHAGLVEVTSKIWDVQDGVIEAALAGHREATTEQLRAVEQQRSMLLDALLSAQSPEAAIPRVATDVLRMPRRGDFVIVAAELPCVSRFPPARTGRSEDRLRRADIHSVWHLRPNARVGIVQLSTRKRLDEVIRVLEKEAAGRMGVSPVYGDLYETGKHLWYAEIAMLSGRADSCAVTVFDDNLVAATAAAAPEVSRRLAREVFGPLDALPPAEREALLHTLETWLGCGGSTEETAKRLCCHPNTVRMRFKRINEHTGRSTFEPLEIAELTLALHALRQAPDLLDTER
jgi:PucR C-terminal helix-turn-helix domain